MFTTFSFQLSRQNASWGRCAVSCFRATAVCYLWWIWQGLFGQHFPWAEPCSSNSSEMLSWSKSPEGPFPLAPCSACAVGAAAKAHLGVGTVFDGHHRALSPSFGAGHNSNRKKMCRNTVCIFKFSLWCYI